MPFLGTLRLRKIVSLPGIDAQVKLIPQMLNVRSGIKLSAQSTVFENGLEPSFVALPSGWVANVFISIRVPVTHRGAPAEALVQR